MRNRFVFMCVVITALPFLAQSTWAQENRIPKISIEFPQLIDSACSQISGKPLEQSAISELEARMDEFVDAWQAIGPALMNEAVAVTGVPFSFHERVAVLHTCEGLFSMSIPLLISARGYLKTLYPDDFWDTDVFAMNFLFHELLHNYLYFSFDEATYDKLAAEYGHLPPIVGNHLHLIALEREVFARLDLGNAIAFSEEFYDQNPLYKQAVEILDEKGAEYFIDQLR